MSMNNLISSSDPTEDGEGNQSDEAIGNHSGGNEIDHDQEAALLPSEKSGKKSKLVLESGRFSCCQVIIICLGVLLLFFSVAMLVGCYQQLIYQFLYPQLTISEGSDALKVWQVTPMPLLLKFYLFNLTNPEEVKDGLPPIVKEIGPYVWREFHEKQNISFHPNHTVTYYQQRWWVWHQEESGSNSQDDVFVTINIIPVTVAWAVRNHWYASMMNMIFDYLEEQLITTTTVGKILFDGVEDPLLNWMQKNVVAENGSYHILASLIGDGGLAEYDKFAWFYKRNMSVEYDGLFNMKTGTDDIANLGLIDWWNKERQTSFYGSPCNQIKGSAGELFPPNNAMDKLVFFSSDLCMSATLYFKEEIEDVGVVGRRYWGSNHTFANGSVVPGNECYCVSGTCAPTGLLNAESCRMGAPAFISFPHFFNADPSLLENVIGLDPNETKHSFIMDIIPELGVPMKVTPRIQINLRLIPDENFRILRNIPDLYFPMLWFEILAEMTPDLASQAKTVTYLLRSPILTQAIWIVLIVASIFTVFLVIFFHYRKVCWVVGSG